MPKLRQPVAVPELWLLNTAQDTYEVLDLDWKQDVDQFIEDVETNIIYGGIDDTVYGVAWNGVTNKAPSQNAAYDAFVAVYAAISAVTISSLGDIGDVALASVTEGDVLRWRTDEWVNEAAPISDTAYDATSWNGVTTIAPSKNAVRDEIENLQGQLDAITSLVSDTAYDDTTWDGVTTVAPSKNAVRDQFEVVGSLIAGNTSSIAGLVDNSAYGAGWDGVTDVAPSQNAVYDKIEALSLGAIASLVDLSDVTITSPVDGQVLVYDSGGWVNADAYLIEDTAFGSGWNGVTDKGASQNAIYDALIQYLPLAGGTLTGFVTAGGGPTTPSIGAEAGSGIGFTTTNTYIVADEVLIAGFSGSGTYFYDSFGEVIAKFEDALIAFYKTDDEFSSAGLIASIQKDQTQFFCTESFTIAPLETNPDDSCPVLIIHNQGESGPSTEHVTLHTSGEFGFIDLVLPDASGTLALLTDIPTVPSPANPTAEVGGTAVNGSATTFMRSDAAPALANPFTPSGGTWGIAGDLIPSGMTRNLGFGADRWNLFAANIIATGSASVGGLEVSGNTDLGDTSANTISANGRFDTSLVPSVTNTNDLGTTGLRWQDLWLSGDSTVAGNAVVGGTFNVAGLVTSNLLGDATSLGSSGNRWVGVWGVDGNFSGDMTVGGSLFVGLEEELFSDDFAILKFGKDDVVAYDGQAMGVYWSNGDVGYGSVILSNDDGATPNVPFRAGSFGTASGSVISAFGTMASQSANAVAITGGTISTSNPITAASFTASLQPLCQIYQSTGQSIAAGGTVALTFDSEDYDPLGLHSTSVNTSRVTLAPGNYLITYQTFNTSSITGTVITRVRVGGNDIRNGGTNSQRTGTVPASEFWSGTAFVRVTSTTYVEIYVTQTDAGAKIFGSNASAISQNSMTVYKLP